MRPYLDASGQNEKVAVALYRWHTHLTAAVQSDLGITEVVLRNAMDRELQTWNDHRTAGTDSWLLSEPATPLRGLTASKRAEANRLAANAFKRRLASHPRYGLPVSHDDVLAHVMFGMWKDLLPNHDPQAGRTRDNSNRDRLWSEALIRAFPNESDPDGSITYWRVTHVHELRNRVAHMEPLLNLDVKDRVGEAFKLVRSIDSVVADWVTGSSQVSALLKQRPA